MLLSTGFVFPDFDYFLSNRILIDAIYSRFRYGPLSHTSSNSGTVIATVETPYDIALLDCQRRHSLSDFNTSSSSSQVFIFSYILLFLRLQ